MVLSDKRFRTWVGFGLVVFERQIPIFEMRMRVMILNVSGYDMDVRYEYEHKLLILVLDVSIGFPLLYFAFLVLGPLFIAVLF